MRLFLLIWLAVFSVQSADLFALVASDDCVEFGSEHNGADPCPAGCARCVCCARMPLSDAPGLTVSVVEPPAVTQAPPPLVPTTDALPRSILHVPKAR